MKERLDRILVMSRGEVKYVGTPQAVFSHNEELEKLGNELLNLKKGVDQVATTLFDFAKRLDIADEQAKAMIQSR